MTEFCSDAHNKTGDPKRAFGKRLRRHVSGRVRDYYVVTTPGCEAHCRREMAGLGLDEESIHLEPGGLGFRGRLVDCQRANLHLRTATRVLMRIDTFTATNFRQLKRKCAAIPWELFLPKGTRPRIAVTSRRSRLYHSDPITGAIVEAVSGHLGPSANAPVAPFLQTLYVRLVNDRATLSLDSSGDPLYKRGLKKGPARAPIRESLAAMILMEAGYDGRRPLVDPMCGSGTFSLEAAMLAKGMAPGGRRRFAFMDWPAFGPSQWTHLKQAAAASERQLDHPLIFSSDIDAEACKLLDDLVAGNGLSDAVRVAGKDFFALRAAHYGDGPGLVVINPPYGRRLGSPTAADDIFDRIGRHLQRAFNGWDVALIAPEPRFLKGLPFPVRQIPIQHGGLTVTLCLGKAVS